MKVSVIGKRYKSFNLNSDNLKFYIKNIYPKKDSFIIDLSYNGELACRLDLNLSLAPNSNLTNFIKILKIDNPLIYQVIENDYEGLLGLNFRAKVAIISKKLMKLYKPVNDSKSG